MTIAERQFPVDGGTVTWGHKVAVGYFAQDHSRHPSPRARTVIEWLHQFNPQASQEELRGLLGQMLFSGDDALKPTEALSGGESARLIFCRLMLQKPNVLVLDEPTNHLDLESINALNIALQKYDGTVLLVTHDHDVIDEVATRIWHFEGGRHRRLQGPVRRIPRLRRRKSLVVDPIGTATKDCPRRGQARVRRARHEIGVRYRWVDG